MLVGQASLSLGLDWTGLEHDDNPSNLHASLDDSLVQMHTFRLLQQSLFFKVKPIRLGNGVFPTSTLAMDSKKKHMTQTIWSSGRRKFGCNGSLSHSVYWFTGLLVLGTISVKLRRLWAQTKRKTRNLDGAHVGLRRSTLIAALTCSKQRCYRACLRDGCLGWEWPLYCV